MTLNASAAVVGVVYLTPKGKQLRREPDRDDFPGKAMFRRLADNELMPLEPTYVLQEVPAEAPVSAVASILGKPIDTVIDAIVGGELSDDNLDELASLDTRPRVQRAIEAEVARRKMPGPVVEVKPAEVAPAIVIVSQGEVLVEEIPLTAPDGKGVWRDGALIVHPPVAVRVEPFPSSDVLPAPIVDAVAPEQTDAPFSAEVADPTISTTSGSSAVALAGGDKESDDAANAPADDLPWPASTPPAAEPVAVHVDGAATATTAPSETVAPPEPAPTADTTTTATKPAKERPRGWCRGCRRWLTIRADGTIMQHFTPDEAKGADGERINCQGVGLTPAPERPPEPALPLPVAMGAEPPVAPVIERPALVSPSADPVIADAVALASEVLAAAATVALESIREHDADAPATGIPRYVRAGGTSYGYTIVDLVPNEPMRREDGAVAVWEREEDADAALVYVREHGELPSDVVDLEAQAVAFREALRRGAEPSPSPELVDHMFPQPTAEEMVESIRQLRDLPEPPTRRALEPTPRPGNPLEALTRIVEEAKSRGVRVRIVIEPIE